jgi:hypothetical protein
MHSELVSYYGNCLVYRYFQSLYCSKRTCCDHGSAQGGLSVSLVDSIHIVYALLAQRDVKGINVLLCNRWPRNLNLSVIVCADYLRQCRA